MEKNTQFYRELIDGLAEGIYRVAVPSGVFEYINPSFRKVFGHSKKTLEAKDLSVLKKVVHPDYLQSVQGRWMDICEKGKVTYPTHEYKAVTEKGAERWIMQTTRGIFDEQKKLIAIEGTCRNITEEKNLKESLLESQRAFQELFDNMQDGIMVFEVKKEKEFYIKDYNNKAVQLSKFKKKDIGMEMRERFPGAVASGYIELLEKTCKTKEPQSFSEMEYVSPEGETLFRAGYVYRLDNGNLILIYDDVTERVLLQRELRDSEERFHELFNKMPSAVAVCEPRNGGKEFYFKDFNKKALELDGIDKKKVVGTEVRAYFPGIKKMGLFELFQNAYKTGKPQYSSELKYINNKGDECFREDSVYKLPNGDIVVIYNDITSQVKLERDLKESEEQFHELFNSMKSAVAVYEVRKNGTEFYFKDINKKAEEIENIKKDRLLGKSLVKVFPGAKKMGMIGLLKEVAQTGVAKHFPRGEYFDKNGDVFYRENYIYRLPNGDVVAVYDDITQQVLSEIELKEKIKESEKLNRFMVGRELRMVELKEKIKQLEEKLKNKPQ